MNIKQILFTALVLWLNATFFIHDTKADNIADSIRIEMKHLTGEHLYQAHSNLYRLAAGEDDLDNELATLSAFINEANRQKNVEAEGQARSMQIMCYYNYYMPDSLKKTLPINLAFMGQHGLWDHYYNSWNTLVELHLYEDNLQTALLEADKICLFQPKSIPVFHFKSIPFNLIMQNILIFLILIGNNCKLKWWFWASADINIVTYLLVNISVR